MKYHAIIIDAQNLFWRAFNSSLQQFLKKPNLTSDGIFPSAIEEFIRRINKFKNEYVVSDGLVFLLFDNPTSVLKQRKLINEDYKSIRLKQNAPEGFYSTLTKLIHILKLYDDSFRLLKLDGCEADDLTAPLISILPKNGRYLTISNDLDWARNLDKNIDWYNYNKLYTFGLFEQDYGFNPLEKRVQLFKAIHGDKSDGIDNAVPYLPKEILLNVVNNSTNIDDLFTNLSEKCYNPKWRKKILENRIKILINYQLVDFVDIQVDIKNLIKKSKRSVEQLRFWYDTLKIPYEAFMNKQFIVKKKEYVK